MKSTIKYFFTLILISVVTQVAFADSEKSYQPMYVKSFKSESEDIKKFLPDMTETFEAILINDDCCTTISRRKFNELVTQRENEKLVLSLEEGFELLGAKSFISGRIIDQSHTGKLKIIVNLIKLNGENLYSAIGKIEKKDLYSDKRDQTIEKLAKKLSQSIKLQNSSSTSPKPTKKLSAKELADFAFGKQKYLKSYWWSLVCQSVDIVYDEEIAELYPDMVGKPAKTNEQISIWNNIFNSTVDEIHNDEIKIRGKKAMPRKKIKNKILNSECKPR